MIQKTPQLPPQNIEAEERVLVACLLDAPAEALSILEPMDFYRTAHQHIFAAIGALAERKEPIDATTLYVELKSMGRIDECGGGAYISKLLNIPAASDVAHFSKMVKAASIGRKLLIAASNISELVYKSGVTPSNAAEITESARGYLSEIGSLNTGYSVPTFAERCLKRIEQYEEFSKSKPLGIRTGFPTLDYLTGGFCGSLLVIIAARPSTGKTAIMMNMARTMASRGHKVGVFSIEMDASLLIDRQIASLSGVDSKRPATGKKLSLDEWRKINEAAEKIYQYPIFIDDTGGIKINELKTRIREMVKNGVEIVFIDQLSRIRGGSKAYEHNTMVVSELAALKKELRIPICLLAQINRRAEDRPDKRPNLMDLKSTGELEESADIVLIGHRPFMFTKKEEDRDRAEWELAKQRDGATTMLYMNWNAATTTFTELSTQKIVEATYERKDIDG